MSDTLAIVGSAPKNGLPAFACPRGLIIAAWIVEYVLRDQRPDEIVSGGADGVDTLAEMGARKHGIPFRAFRPTVRRWAGHGGFKERNIRIAYAGDRFLRIACAETGTYGSGWTVDLAEKFGKPVERLFIHGDGTVTRSTKRRPPAGQIVQGPDLGLTWTIPTHQLQIGGAKT